MINSILNKLLSGYLDEKYGNKIIANSQEIIDLKRQVKVLKNEKINIVFVCHRAHIWDALKSIYEACMEDNEFDVTIVTIPNKKQLPKKGLSHEEYVSEGASEYFKDYPCRVIEGYDYESKKWFDLKSLQPDYLFFQTPYDICRPPEYQSSVVSMYTKIGYVHYGMPFMDGYIAEESFPVSYLKNTYFHFAEFEEMRKYYVNRVEDNCIHKKSRVLLTGYPKIDEGKKYVGCESDSWKYTDKERKLRVMWTPRWNTEENNCTFFEFKDLLVDYIREHSNIEFLFRPHPQAFSEFISRKQMSETEVEAYKECYRKLENASIDEQQEYLPSFYSSDVLITDESSIIPEYFLTGKPIIFTYKETHLNDFAKKISEGFYWVKDWDEMKNILSKLEKGEDELREKRLELINEAFYIPEKGSGYEIKELIKKDFRGIC